MSWVNDNNCYILNTCINSQNIDSSNGDQILDTLLNNWSGVTQAFQNGGCQAVQQMVNPNASACSNNQGLFTLDSLTAQILSSMDLSLCSVLL